MLLRLVSANQEKIELESGAEPYEEDSVALQDKIELAKFIMKSFNSLMLKVIKQLEPDKLLHALFSIVIACCNREANELIVGLYNLAFKCLMKFNKDFKKSPHQIDPSLVFQLVYNFMSIHERSHGLPKNNYQTIEALLKLICQKIDLNYVI